MIGWLLDTLAWTAALIALVLVLRRPVARWFGPQAAYALWLLPMLRLILPPIELPAWLRPAPDGSGALRAAGENAQAAAPGDQVVILLDPGLAAQAQPTSLIDTLPLAELVLALWLGGAAIFLFLRFNLYFRMRRRMLDGAREAGRAGRVRLVESPAAVAPLAFGVRDKVIALPQGFMARHDREVRDLALEHELWHHHGHDLLVNFLVQPLFAMHWFNPLGRAGWLALRRDQEAACDARVMRQRPPRDRATYANVIASFAAGPNLALAAPMACPVLGDKSIIHRLRSLNMNEPSARRRMAGRGLMAAALVALPLTASISYAEATAPTPPEAPLAPVAPPAPPAPPAPADAPAPPAPPAAPVWFQSSSEAAKDGDVEKRVFIIRKTGEGDAQDGAEGAPEVRSDVRRERKVVIRKGDGQLSKEEHAEMMRELHEELANIDIEIADAMKEQRLAMVELGKLGENMTVVQVDCKDGEPGQTTDAKGRKVVKLCTSKIMASALKGLESARAELARDKEMSEEIRAEVLRSLDAEIARFKDKQG